MEKQILLDLVILWYSAFNKTIVFKATLHVQESLNIFFKIFTFFLTFYLELLFLNSYLIKGYAKVSSHLYLTHTHPDAPITTLQLPLCTKNSPWYTSTTTAHEQKCPSTSTYTKYTLTTQLNNFYLAPPIPNQPKDVYTTHSKYIYALFYLAPTIHKMVHP